MSTRALLQLPVARLTRLPRTLLAPAAFVALGIAAAFASRVRGGSHAVDTVLLGAYSELALPLFCLGIVAVVLRNDRLDTAGASLVGFGAPPARVALAQVAVAMVVCAAAGAALAALIVVIAGAGRLPIGVDVAASAYAGALGGAAYAGLFAFGSAFGPKGSGRSAVFVIDWILGSGRGVPAFFVPRGHLRSLLGDRSHLDLAPAGSGVALVLLAVILTTLAVGRASRVPR